MLPKPKVAKPEPADPIAKRGKGRPKGAKNKTHKKVVLNAEMAQLKPMLETLLATVSGTIKTIYFVYDGAFGNHAAVQMTTDVGLHLISKLRFDSALYFPWQGEYAGRGAPRKYGNKVNYHEIPDEFLHSTEYEKDIIIKTYQCQLLHMKFEKALNVVILLKENSITKKVARVILFSSDLTLGCSEIVEYYRLRFQIEFNFRDAKQHWRLEDFMVTQEVKVNNAANLAMWMVNVSQVLLKREQEESIIDLKARFHGLRYVKEVLKTLRKSGTDIKMSPQLDDILILGRIHWRKPSRLAA